MTKILNPHNNAKNSRVISLFFLGEKAAQNKVSNHSKPMVKNIYWL